MDLSSEDTALLQAYMELFAGRTDAFGTGAGRVVRAELLDWHYQQHLRGGGEGLGVFPLRDDGTVSFAAVDLDEPDFETARAIQELLPGTTWVERSRSGNAHVWAFFSSPIQAWVARGVMKAALFALGRERVEVFPKQDSLMPGMVGNYINLPYHGRKRPVLIFPPAEYADQVTEADPAIWVPGALATRNDPMSWSKRAEYLNIEPPERRTTSDHEFGTSPVLHECALHILEGARSGERPVREGHRSVVYFSLAKQLLDWEQMGEEQAWELVEEVNSLSPDPFPARELHRIFRNAASGRWTSTGCDDPLMGPYVHPNCPIAGRLIGGSK